MTCQKGCLGDAECPANSGCDTTTCTCSKKTCELPEAWDEEAGVVLTAEGQGVVIGAEAKLLCAGDGKTVDVTCGTSGKWAPENGTIVSCPKGVKRNISFSVFKKARKIRMCSLLLQFRADPTQIAAPDKSASMDFAS